MEQTGPILSDYSFVAVVLLAAVGLALGAAAGFARAPRRTVNPAPSWTQFRFGYAVYALIFLAFDMEMIFMYPWTLVVADMGAKAVVEMFLFLGILLVGVVYAWREGALRWV